MGDEDGCIDHPDRRHRETLGRSHRKSSSRFGARISAHRLACDAQKEEERRRIETSEKARCAQTLEDAKQKIQNETENIRREIERRLAAPGLQSRVRDEILHLLLKE